MNEVSKQNWNSVVIGNPGVIHYKENPTRD